MILLVAADLNDAAQNLNRVGDISAFRTFLTWKSFHIWPKWGNCYRNVYKYVSLHIFLDWSLGADVPGCESGVHAAREGQSAERCDEIRTESDE
jgi:hypothetical protein